MRFDVSFVLILLLAGCAGGGLPLRAPEPAQALPAPAPSDLTPVQMARYMADAAAWQADALAAELRHLQAGPLTAADRFKLAWLLARKGGRVEDAARAQELLAGLEGAFADAGARQLLLLVQRIARLELEVRQERRRATALQDKIELLKGLERDLHERAKSEAGK